MIIQGISFTRKFPDGQSPHFKLGKYPYYWKVPNQVFHDKAYQQIKHLDHQVVRVQEQVNRHLIKTCVFVTQVLNTKQTKIYYRYCHLFRFTPLQVVHLQKPWYLPVLQETYFKTYKSHYYFSPAVANFLSQYRTHPAAEEISYYHPIQYIRDLKMKITIEKHLIHNMQNTLTKYQKKLGE